MNDELNIESIIAKADQARRLAAAAAALELIASVRIAEQAQEHESIRAAFADRVKTAGAAVAQRLHEAEVPYTVDTVRRFRPGVRLWFITASQSKTVRYEHVPNPIYHDENARRGYGPRDGEPRELKLPHDVLISVGLALNDDGMLWKYAHESGRLANQLQVTEATTGDILAAGKMRDSDDVDSAAMIWRDLYAQMFVPKDNT